jgi:hypothetical protein
MATQNSINNQVLNNDFTIVNGDFYIANGNGYVPNGIWSIGTTTPSLGYDLTIERAVAGAMGISIQNNSNNAVASSVIYIQTEQATADPFIGFVINGAQNYSYGIDNSDSDALKMTDGASVSSGNILWNMTTAGERTMPLQPAFLAVHSAAQNNITGNGTLATINFTTEIFDQNGDYDGTNTFTAPVTGKYFLKGSVLANNLTNATTGSLRITTSNRFYSENRINYTVVQDSVGAVGSSVSVVADMDAGDTATVGFTLTGIGADSADVPSAVNSTYFSGVLIC